MGYFSEMDFMQYEEAEWSSSSKVQLLAERIDYLNESLADLEARCPRDMSDPGYDRMFYAESLNETCDVSTIQGVLQGICKTEELLQIAEDEARREREEQQRHREWSSTVLETGATPDYQIVLLSVFFPVADPSVAA